ncbi:LPS export ABC transporter periplasmic protein LptC [Pseudomonas sp. 2822-15]|uniref:Lipopolysaccharide export system protein LptC n=1 Tax=Pseudomonas salomonii TaxID=191391 RepID=A0A1H3CPF5_9PSED|nr:MULTISPECIES: LPS export ABC transporter periplasmic protein LptC [Pseudomonas]NWF09072.1 LPS export ABC transporter periplasmic protein LptC [Pseudomonas salomonii]PIB46663.1 LPS export ABC transporter periplasmic protein LptC [Pseudomonas sp. 2822-15]CRM53404.1 lipopolysaccharide exporter periplasmic protein [Pseudomonas sp. 58 R 3]SDX55464.1 lipopolysaccharide export system protein LptC [Pseudomonas salomonii]
MLSKKIRNFLLFGVIAALFLAVGYWNISPERFLDKPVAQVDEGLIDNFATNAYTVQFTLEGKVQYEMTAEKVEHVKASEVSLLTNPDLNLFRGTDFPWHVTSKRGEVNADGTQVELIDSVRVARTDEQKRDTIITSSRMTVFPQQQYAQTEQDVRIDGAGGVSTGKGMKAYLKESRIHLLSNVRGQYEAR